MKRICRMCLHNASDTVSIHHTDNFGISAKSFVKALLPELDLGISVNPVICRTCYYYLRQAYSLRLKWLRSENLIGIYMSESKNKNNTIALKNVVDFWINQYKNKPDELKGTLGEWFGVENYQTQGPIILNQTINVPDQNVFAEQQIEPEIFPKSSTNNCSAVSDIVKDIISDGLKKLDTDEHTEMELSADEEEKKGNCKNAILLDVEKEFDEFMHKACVESPTIDKQLVDKIAVRTYQKQQKSVRDTTGRTATPTSQPDQVEQRINLIGDMNDKDITTLIIDLQKDENLKKLGFGECDTSKNETYYLKKFIDKIDNSLSFALIPKLADRDFIDKHAESTVNKLVRHSDVVFALNDKIDSNKVKIRDKSEQEGVKKTEQVIADTVALERNDESKKDVEKCTNLANLVRVGNFKVIKLNSEDTADMKHNEMISRRYREIRPKPDGILKIVGVPEAEKNVNNITIGGTVDMGLNEAPKEDWENNKNLLYPRKPEHSGLLQVKNIKELDQSVADTIITTEGEVGTNKTCRVDQEICQKLQKICHAPELTPVVNVRGVSELKERVDGISIGDVVNRKQDEPGDNDRENCPKLPENFEKRNANDDIIEEIRVLSPLNDSIDCVPPPASKEIAQPEQLLPSSSLDNAPDTVRPLIRVRPVSTLQKVRTLNHELWPQNPKCDDYNTDDAPPKTYKVSARLMGCQPEQSSTAPIVLNLKLGSADIQKLELPASIPKKPVLKTYVKKFRRLGTPKVVLPGKRINPLWLPTTNGLEKKGTALIEASKQCILNGSGLRSCPDGRGDTEGNVEGRRGIREDRNEDIIDIKDEPLDCTESEVLMNFGLQNDESTWSGSECEAFAVDPLSTENELMKSIMDNIPEVGDEQYDVPEYVHINNVTLSDLEKLMDENKKLTQAQSPNSEESKINAGYITKIIRNELKSSFNPAENTSKPYANASRNTGNRKKGKRLKLIPVETDYVVMAKRRSAVNQRSILKTSVNRNLTERNPDDGNICVLYTSFTNEGDYINDHDYLINPYVRNHMYHNRGPVPVCVCLLCDLVHPAIDHIAHMSRHKTVCLMCKIDFHNAFILNLHVKCHSTFCCECQTLIRYADQVEHAQLHNRSLTLSNIEIPAEAVRRYVRKRHKTVAKQEKEEEPTLGSAVYKTLEQLLSESVPPIDRKKMKLGNSNSNSSPSKTYSRRTRKTRSRKLEKKDSKDEEQTCIGDKSINPFNKQQPLEECNDDNEKTETDKEIKKAKMNLDDGITNKKSNISSLLCPETIKDRSDDEVLDLKTLLGTESPLSTRVCTRSSIIESKKKSEMSKMNIPSEEPQSNSRRKSTRLSLVDSKTPKRSKKTFESQCAESESSKTPISEAQSSSEENPSRCRVVTSSPPQIDGCMSKANLNAINSKSTRKRKIHIDEQEVGDSSVSTETKEGAISDSIEALECSPSNGDTKTVLAKRSSSHENLKTIHYNPFVSLTDICQVPELNAKFVKPMWSTIPTTYAPCNRKRDVAVSDGSAVTSPSHKELDSSSDTTKIQEFSDVSVDTKRKTEIAQAQDSIDTAVNKNIPAERTKVRESSDFLVMEDIKLQRGFRLCRKSFNPNPFANNRKARSSRSRGSLGLVEGLKGTEKRGTPKTPKKPKKTVQDDTPVDLDFSELKNATGKGPCELKNTRNESSDLKNLESDESSIVSWETSQSKSTGLDENSSDLKMSEEKVVESSESSTVFTENTGV